MAVATYLSNTGHALPWGFTPAPQIPVESTTAPATDVVTTSFVPPTTATTTTVEVAQETANEPQSIPVTKKDPETTTGSTESVPAIQTPASAAAGTTEPATTQKGYLFVNLHKLRSYLKFEFEHLHLYDWDSSNTTNLKNDTKQQQQQHQQLGADQEQAQDIPAYKKYPWEFSLSRVINDFIFLTTFVGNDFLPALPALDIEGTCFFFFKHMCKNFDLLILFRRRRGFSAAIL